jgi:hypothetical protein
LIPHAVKCIKRFSEDKKIRVGKLHSLTRSQENFTGKIKARIENFLFVCPGNDHDAWACAIFDLMGKAFERRDPLLVKRFVLTLPSRREIPLSVKSELERLERIKKYFYSKKLGEIKVIYLDEPYALNKIRGKVHVINHDDPGHGNQLSKLECLLPASCKVISVNVTDHHFGQDVLLTGIAEGLARRYGKEAIVKTKFQTNAIANILTLITQKHSVELLDYLVSKHPPIHRELIELVRLGLATDAYSSAISKIEINFDSQDDNYFNNNLRASIDTFCEQNDLLKHLWESLVVNPKLMGHLGFSPELTSYGLVNLLADLAVKQWMVNHAKVNKLLEGGDKNPLYLKWMYERALHRHLQDDFLAANIIFNDSRAFLAESLRVFNQISNCSKQTLFFENENAEATIIPFSSGDFCQNLKAAYSLGELSQEDVRRTLGEILENIANELRLNKAKIMKNQILLTANSIRYSRFRDFRLTSKKAQPSNSLIVGVCHLEGCSIVSVRKIFGELHLGKLSEISEGIIGGNRDQGASTIPHSGMKFDKVKDFLNEKGHSIHGLNPSEIVDLFVQSICV